MKTIVEVHSAEGGDDSKLFRRDESAFYADRSKANIGGAFLRARHVGTPGSRE